MNSTQTNAALLTSHETAAIHEINPLTDPRWNAFIAQHPHASVSHRREWLQTLLETYGCEPSAVTLCAPGAPLTNALLFCRVRSDLTGRRLVSVPFSDDCEPLAAGSAEIDALVEGLTGLVSKAGWKYLEIRPRHYAPALPDLAVCKTYFSHRLPLQLSEEALFRSFHKDCIQRKILRANRESLQSDEGFSETLLRDFYKLMVTTRRRLGLPPQPQKWFRNLGRNLGKDLKIRVAYKSGSPVAAILTIRTNGTMVYKYGCSDARFNNLGGMMLLLWNAIREARAAGLSEFDLGRSDVDQQGLIAFKEHWGAERFSLNYWRYPAPGESTGIRLPAALLRRIGMRMPEASLRVIGSLLYKHIA